MKDIYEKLYGLLTEWNGKFNLTAIKSKEDFEIKHIRDSMLGLPFINGKVLDVGSGAGFPGLVIKIEKPECDVTLIDSVRKKTDYLTTVINELGLSGIRAVHTRVEDITERESFDTVTARAVAPLVTLAEYCLPFVRLGGGEESGVYILPAELIENNADVLKDCVDKYASIWELPDAFVKWNKTFNFYCNTLVDRIVSGYPQKDEDIRHIESILGEDDKLVTIAEPFGLWLRSISPYPAR